MFLIVVLIVCVHTMEPEIVDLLTPVKQLGEACGYDACPSLPDDRINVHLVPHSHAELGHAKHFDDYWTGQDFDHIFEIRIGASMINMKMILDATITELWANQERRFTLSDSELPYFFHWWARRDGTVRRMVYQLLRQGRLNIVGGGWGMNDECSTSYQSIIDSYTYSLRKLNRTFLSCARPLVAWQSDAIGHSREYASLVAQMGFDGLFINPISYDDELVRMDRNALEFLWRGSDDLGKETDIFTNKLFDGHWSPPGFCFSINCFDPLLVTTEKTFTNLEERVNLFISQSKFRQAPFYKSKNILVVMGNRNGYHSARTWFRNIDALINAANAKTYAENTKVFLHYSTPHCYLKAVHESRPQLDLKQDDFIPYAYDKFDFLTGVFTSRPDLKYFVRVGNVFLQMSKQLQVLAKLGFDDVLEEFMWIMGVMQDHNIISGALRNHAKSYYMKRLDGAIQKAMTLIGNGINKLQNNSINIKYHRCDFNSSTCLYTRTESFQIVIYNSLAWRVSTPVRIPVERAKYYIYHPNGDLVKASILPISAHTLKISTRKTKSDHEIVFIANDIPPLGFKSFYIKKVKKEKRSIKKLIQNNKAEENRTFFEAIANYDYDNEKALKYDYSNNREYVENTIDYVDEDKKENIASVNKYTADKNDVYFTPRIENGIMAKVRLGREKHFVPETTTGTSTMADVFLNEDNEEPIYVQESNDVDSETTQMSTREDNDTSDTTTEESPTTETIHTSEESTTETHTSEESTTEVSSSTEISQTSEGTSTEITFSTDGSKTEVPSSTETTQTSESSTEESSEEISGEISTDVLNPEVITIDVSTKHTISSTEPQEAEDSEIVTEDIKTMATEAAEFKEISFPPKFRARDRKDTVESKDTFIQNEYIKLNLDRGKVSSMTLSNNLSTSLDIQFFYYISDDPDKLNKENDVKCPGVYLFRPMDPKPVPIIDYLDAKIYKTDIVQEIHTEYADYASVVIKLYAARPYIEIDWTIGPLPDDGYGKEVFLRYSTDLDNGGVFYTDSNGRQTVKRIKNRRPTYEPYHLEEIAGNIYPVTSKIYIEDTKKDVRFSIFNDRSQGGTSLFPGSIDLMIQRRLFTDDSGMQIYLNETINGKDIIIAGKHYLYLSKANFKPNKVYEKKLAKEIELKPITLISNTKMSFEKWLQLKNEFSGVQKLPLGVHILTIQNWNDGTLLLRLENYLEKCDTVKTGIKYVFLKELFFNIEIERIKETNLAANEWKENYVQLQWEKNGSFVKNFNDYYGTEKLEYGEEEEKKSDDSNNGIKLVPQQIRTFVVWYKNKD